MDTLPPEIIVHIICADINAFIICALLMTSHGVRRAVRNGVPSLKSLVISNRYYYLAYIVHISTCGPITRTQLLRTDNVANIISRALGMRIIEPIIDFTRIWRLDLDPEYLKFIFRAVVVSNEFKYRLAHHMSKYRSRFLRNTRQWIDRYINEITDVLENGALNINKFSRDSRIEFYLASREGQIAPSLQDKLPQEKGNYEDVKIVAGNIKIYAKYGIMINCNRKMHMNIIPIIINQEVENACVSYSPYYERKFLSADEFLIATNYASDDDIATHILSNNINEISIGALRYMIDCGYNKSILAAARILNYTSLMCLISISMRKNNVALLKQVICVSNYFQKIKVKKYINWEQRVLSINGR